MPKNSTLLNRLQRLIAPLCGALLALVTGCRAKPLPPPSVADLKFPVAVNYQRAAVVLFTDATDLGTMSLGQMNGISGPPPLIDSSFAIYTLKDLRSTHGSLWLMANPTGFTPVTFTLERAPKSGIEAVREIIRGRLDEQTWRDDLPAKRNALAAEQTLAGMVALLRGNDSK